MEWSRNMSFATFLLIVLGIVSCMLYRHIIKSPDPHRKELTYLLMLIFLLFTIVFSVSFLGYKIGGVVSVDAVDKKVELADKKVKLLDESLKKAVAQSAKLDRTTQELSEALLEFGLVLGNESSRWGGMPKISQDIMLKKYSKRLEALGGFNLNTEKIENDAKETIQEIQREIDASNSKK